MAINWSPNIKWDRIEAFIGYGNLDAPVIFIGAEEGVGPATNIAADMLKRSDWAPVVDIKEVTWPDADRRFCDDVRRVSLQPTWRRMCYLMALRSVPTRIPTTHELKEYQSRKLGRSDGDTLLTELLPYPSPHRGVWEYTNRDSDRQVHEKRVLPSRIAMLRGLLDVERKFIFCYGSPKALWPHFSSLFPQVRWNDGANCRFGMAGRTTVILTPHFTCRELNSYEPLRQIAATVGFI